MTPDERNRLLTRLTQSEDPWVERKESFDDREVRKILVGFANSVREGESAILFLGARNDGIHPGVNDADDLQKKVDGVATKKCYPPILYKPAVLTVDVRGQSKEVLAVLVPFSANRPHFAGPAYIRHGPETLEASREMFLDLIASQNDKARRILQFKGKCCWLRINSKSGFWFELECIVGSCDAHSVTLWDTESLIWSFPLSNIEILRTPIRDLEIIAPPQGTEEEHIRELVRRWARFRTPPAPGEYQLPSDWAVNQLLANPGMALPAVAALADGSNDGWLRLLHLHLHLALKKSEHGMSRPQKLKRMETLYLQKMKGQSPASNTSVVAAAVHSTAEVATSLAEAEEFLKFVAKQHAGLAQVEYATLWNALLHEWKF